MFYFMSYSYDVFFCGMSVSYVPVPYLLVDSIGLFGVWIRLMAVYLERLLSGIGFNNGLPLP